MLGFFFISRNIDVVAFVWLYLSFDDLKTKYSNDDEEHVIMFII